MKMLKFIYIIVFLTSFISCNGATLPTRKQYTSMYIQSGRFGSSDIDSLFNEQKLISEDSVKRIICSSDKKYKEKILLTKSNKQVVVSIKKKLNKQTIIYSMDSIDFLIFHSNYDEHYDKIFVLYDKKFNPIIYELIDNEKFILKKLNEEYPSNIESTVEYKTLNK